MITCVPRSKVGKAAWNHFVGTHPSGWFWHTWEWQEYCVNYESCVEWSVGLTHGAELVGVVPLFLTKSEPAFAMAGGTHCAVPLFSTHFSHMNTIVPTLDAHIQQMNSTPPFRLVFRGSPLAETYSCPWWTDESWQSQVVDLTKDSSSLWSGVRSSYHSLINKQKKEYVYSVTCGASVKSVLPFIRALHRTAAGRETRPESTWTIMGRWVEEGKALLTTVQQYGSGEIVGYVLAVLYKQQAYYASGVSVEGGHAAQWLTIEELKARDITAYELGWQGVADEKKGQDIEFFKRGFGGKTVPMPAYVYHPYTIDHPAASADTDREGTDRA